jgi:hypothetical protein
MNLFAHAKVFFIITFLLTILIFPTQGLTAETFFTKVFPSPASPKTKSLYGRFVEFTGKYSFLLWFRCATELPIFLLHDIRIR